MIDPKTLQNRSNDELIALIVELSKAVPGTEQYLRQRKPCPKEMQQLIKAAGAELKRATAVPSGYSSRGYEPPNYRELHRLLERLVDVGEFDFVLDLGERLIGRATDQISNSGSDDSAHEQLVECFAIVTRALLAAEGSGRQRILYLLRVTLGDDYGFAAGLWDAVINFDMEPAEWLAAADEINQKLRSMPGESEGVDHHLRYNRSTVADLALIAFERGGKPLAAREMLEREAESFHEYSRLVGFLFQHGLNDDADRWAARGIEATASRFPGIAAQCVESLLNAAQQAGDWLTVAAILAEAFLSSAGVETLNDLIMAAEKAGMRSEVEAQAMLFLETGVAPVQVVRTTAKKIKLEVAASWPLPIVQSLTPLIAARRENEPAQPAHPVLIELAILRRDPQLIWRRYEAMTRAARKTQGWVNEALRIQVAEAVKGSRPGDAKRIYLDLIRSHLVNAKQSSYESVGDYLAKIRPLFDLEDGGWEAFVRSIREDYPRRRNLLAILDALLEGGG